MSSKHRPSHVKPREKRSAVPTILILLLILIILFLAASNFQPTYAFLGNQPVIGPVVQRVHFLSPAQEAPVDSEIPDDPTELSSETAALPLTDGSAELPMYLIEEGIAPRHLKLTIYDASHTDIDAILQALTSLSCVRDAYSTVVLEDSMAVIVAELNREMAWTAVDNTDGGTLDLTFSESGANTDDPVFLIRGDSDEMGEELASQMESISDYNPTIIKTQDGLYCVTVGAYPTEKEAQEILDLLDGEFYLEETTVSSSPVE